MWDIGDVLGKGWEGFKNNVGGWIITLIVAFVIIFAVNLVMGILTGIVGKSEVMALVMVVVTQIISLIVSTLINLGFVGIALKVARGESFGVGDLFAHMDKLVPAIVAGLIVGIAAMIGTLLLIVPGVIIALGLMFYLYFIVDKGAGIGDCISSSWNATKGHKLKLFLFLIVVMLISIVAMIPLGLGLFVVLPMIMVAMANIYLTITGESGAAQAPAA